jgi:hypothetical protein
MTSKLSQNFELLPSLDPNGAPLSPSAYFPAIPIQIGNTLGDIVFATIDISLQVSLVERDFAEKMQIGFSLKDQNIKLSDKFGYMMTTIIVLEPTLQPWLKFNRVPFGIMSNARKFQDSSKVVLGYKSFLAYLRLVIDFPKRTLTLTGLKDFLFSETPPNKPLIPSGIVEAEDLIESGSFTSGSALLVAGLEQWLLQSNTINLSSPVSAESLKQGVRLLTGDSSFAHEIDEMYKLRNLAIHGTRSDPIITEEEARTALATAKRIIRKTKRID